MPVPFWVGKYIGIPFKEHGRTERGLDCWGLVRLVFREEYSIELPSIHTYSDTKDDVAGMKAAIEKEQKKWIPIEDIEDAIDGDVLILRMAGHPIHVGLVVGDGEFIHAYEGQNVVKENYQSRRWKNKVVNVYRHTDMDLGE